jgi:transposase
MYSAQNPSSLAAISATLASIASERRFSPQAALRHIPTLQSMLSERLQRSKDTRLVLAQARLATKIVRASVRLKRVYHNLPESKNIRENIRLEKAAALSMPLIKWSFHDYGITRDADSFRGKLDKSDLKSAHPLVISRPFLEEPFYPYIPNRQWALIEPLIPPREKAACRGRPPADPRELLGAIFWKFAHAARWQDLPAGSPPMLTCRRYYRRLFLSGRLLTIYRRLYTDFLQHSRLGLPALVKRGAFLIVNHKVTLRSGLSENWYLRTALLFLQLAYQVYRRMENRIMLEQRRLFAIPRLPAMRFPRLTPGIVPSRMPEEALAAPVEEFLPIEESFAWKKWKNIEKQDRKMQQRVDEHKRRPAAQGIRSSQFEENEYH